MLWKREHSNTKNQMDQKKAEMEKLVTDFNANKNRCIMLPD